MDQLNLTEDQKAKVEELRQEYGPKLAEFGKKVTAILTDEQRKDRQEATQAARAAGTSAKEIFDAGEAATKATDEQRAKITEVRKEQAPVQREVREKILALLTAEQKEKLPKGHNKGKPAPKAQEK